MNEKKPNPAESVPDLSENEKIIDSYDYLANAASPWDCTGLIPSAPLSKEELESYESVYRFEPPTLPPKSEE